MTWSSVSEWARSIVHQLTTARHWQITMSHFNIRSFILFQQLFQQCKEGKTHENMMEIIQKTRQRTKLRPRRCCVRPWLDVGTVEDANLASSTRWCQNKVMTVHPSSISLGYHLQRCTFDELITKLDQGALKRHEFQRSHGTRNEDSNQSLCDTWPPVTITPVWRIISECHRMRYLW